MRNCCVILAVAALGCATPKVVESPLPTADFDQQRAGVALPKADGTKIVPPPLASVLVTPTQMLLEGDDYPIALLSQDERGARGSKGLPKRYKRSGEADLFISPLYQGLAHLGAEMSPPSDDRSIVVLADGATPFRVMMEVVYTAAQAKCRTWIGVAPKGQQAIPIEIPPKRAGTTRRLRSISLNLNVLITSDGISLKTSSGSIATGCESIGRGVTVPKNKAGAHDLAALTKCAQSLKSQNERFAKETRSMLTASPDTPLQTIVDVVGVLRAPTLFPKVAWGVMK